MPWRKLSSVLLALTQDAEVVISFGAAADVYDPLTTLGKDWSQIGAGSDTRAARYKRVMENRHGSQGRAQTARTHHCRQLRDHQHRPARPPADRRRERADPARAR